MKPLLADTIYKRFFPVRCSRCGIKHDFNRQIFHITGVAKNKRADDETQNWLQYHFLQYHKIQYVFFREYSKKFYVDSASCPSCKSTAIVFDIDHDYVMANYAKMAEENIIQFKEKN
jgi:ribosomal protein S27E